MSFFTNLVGRGAKTPVKPPSAPASRLLNAKINELEKENGLLKSANSKQQLRIKGLATRIKKERRNSVVTGIFCTATAAATAYYLGANPGAISKFIFTTIPKFFKGTP